MMAPHAHPRSQRDAQRAVQKEGRRDSGSASASAPAQKRSGSSKAQLVPRCAAPRPVPDGGPARPGYSAGAAQPAAERAPPAGGVSQSAPPRAAPRPAPAAGAISPRAAAGAVSAPLPGRAPGRAQRRPRPLLGDPELPLPLWVDESLRIPDTMVQKQRAVWRAELAAHPFIGAGREPRADLNSRLCIIKHDITKMRVGALVNAANTALAGGIGLDAAVHCGAGPGLAQELRGKRCAVGDAVVSSGHRLPCEYIFHAVAPMGGKGDDLLRGCYEASAEHARRRNLSSVAFCCLGTGSFQFPRLRAAHIALDFARSWLERDAHIEVVAFCTFEQKDLDIYRWLAREHYFPPAPVDSAAAPEGPAAPPAGGHDADAPPLAAPEVVG
eukprot:TRINITY_DN51014_c0_g1_i1.p1 TRINITY_DN51014_c0_g1~~TRINITY_DN51014_c0_g1_i1.p1  ORF type:complete len:416 (+),score=63.83 TRINITY_DN51014_c0_g1_i1:99-1250(+)